MPRYQQKKLELPKHFSCHNNYKPSKILQLLAETVKTSKFRQLLTTTSNRMFKKKAPKQPNKNGKRNVQLLFCFFEEKTEEEKKQFKKKKKKKNPKRPSFFATQSPAPPRAAPRLPAGPPPLRARRWLHTRRRSPRCRRFGRRRLSIFKEVNGDRRREDGFFFEVLLECFFYFKEVFFF